jgi:hypothetical protein
MDSYKFTVAICSMMLAVVVPWRIFRRSLLWRDRLHQLFGGLNVILALLVIFLTLVTFSMKSNQRMDHELRWSGFFFVVAMAIIWITWGLVPRSVCASKIWALWLGHLLILVGTSIYGLVTFYSPVLVWLGVVSQQDTVVLPWLAFFTLPAAVVLWLVGFFFATQSEV